MKIEFKSVFFSLLYPQCEINPVEFKLASFIEILQRFVGNANLILREFDQIKKVFSFLQKHCFGCTMQVENWECLNQLSKDTWITIMAFVKHFNRKMVIIVFKLTSIRKN